MNMMMKKSQMCGRIAPGKIQAMGYKGISYSFEYTEITLE